MHANDALTDAQRSGSDRSRIALGAQPRDASSDAHRARARLAAGAPGTRAGYWCGELEGDTTLESYLILLDAFFGAPPATAQRARRSLGARRSAPRRCPAAAGASTRAGPADLSVSCLSYFALKVAGDAADAPHMRARARRDPGAGRRRARQHYTRYHLAMFGQFGWSDVAGDPARDDLPARRAAPFSVYDMSSWSRTIFVPLSILYAQSRSCALPPERGVAELFARRAAQRPAAPARAPAGDGRRGRSSPASTARSRLASACRAPARCGERRRRARGAPG